MSCIYVMTVGADLIKIGFANDPARRRYQLQRETDHQVELYAAFDCGGMDHRRIEAAIHAALKGCCVYREVFRMAPTEALPIIAAAFGLTPHELTSRQWEAPRPCDVISPVQAVMARAVLRWALPEVRERTGLSVNTVLRFEQGKGCNPGTVVKLRDIYEAEGVRFRPDGITVTAP
jgi:hypothetical protein